MRQAHGKVEGGPRARRGACGHDLLKLMIGDLRNDRRHGKQGRPGRVVRSRPESAWLLPATVTSGDATISQVHLSMLDELKSLLVSRLKFDPRRVADLAGELVEMPQPIRGDLDLEHEVGVRREAPEGLARARDERALRVEHRAQRYLRVGLEADGAVAAGGAGDVGQLPQPLRQRRDAEGMTVDTQTVGGVERQFLETTLKAVATVTRRSQC